MGTARRQFTDEFKLEAVGLLANSGRPLSQIAQELGIAASMLRSWRNRGEPSLEMMDTSDKLLIGAGRCLMGTARRQFTDEFKREAVGLLASSGRPLSQIAQELGIAASRLRAWRNRGDGGHAGSPRRSQYAGGDPACRCGFGG